MITIIENNNEQKWIDRKIAEWADTNKASAARVLESLMGSKTEELTGGGEVTLVGFGTYKVITVLNVLVAILKQVQRSKLLRQKLLLLKRVKHWKTRLTCSLFRPQTPLYTGVIFVTDIIIKASVEIILLLAFFTKCPLNWKFKLKT